MVGILHYISTPYHDDIFPSSVFFVMTAQDYHDKIMILMTLNLVRMMIAVKMTTSNSQGNNNNHTQPVVNRLTLLLNCELFFLFIYLIPAASVESYLILAPKKEKCNKKQVKGFRNQMITFTSLRPEKLVKVYSSFVVTAGH